MIGTMARRRSAVLVAFAGITLVGLAVVQLGLRFVLSPSLPLGVYRTIDGPPVRGAIVMACLPASVARFALARGYVWRGSCPGGAVPLGKVVLGVAGDSLVLSADGIVRNGVPVPNSAPRTQDSRGRPIPHIPYGRWVLGPGQLWLFSPYHPLSFDSRYFGPIASANVVARLAPLWTRPASATAPPRVSR